MDETVAISCERVGVFMAARIVAAVAHDGWWAWVDLNHRPRPYQGLLWCYTHSSVAMITLLTTSI